MPLLLQHCGMNLRSATIVIASLAMFFSGYRLIKDVIAVDVLHDIDNGSKESDEFPHSSIQTMEKVLITDLALSAIFFLSSLILLLGVFKGIAMTMMWWAFMACIFIAVDLGVTIYLAITYYELSGITLSIVINCFWYAVGLYSMCVVLYYSKMLRSGNEYQNLGV